MVQLPALQVGVPCVASHTLSHWPQWASSFCRSMHSLPHFVKLVLHEKPQTELLQLATPLAGAGHTVGQMPQCCGSMAVFTHWPPQFVVPFGQVTTQWPLAHSSFEPQ